MTFAEKLRRLMAGREQAEIAKVAGIAPSALSNYLNRDSLPGVEIALKLSKVFECPLNWMVDDSREWENEGRVSDYDLMAEVCRRLVDQAGKVREQLIEMRKMPWPEIRRELLEIPVDDPLPLKYEPIIQVLVGLENSLEALNRFDASRALPLHIDNAPKVGELKDALKDLKDLKAEPDIAKAFKYKELRELAKALVRNNAKSSDYDLEGHRKRLQKMKA